MLYQEWKERLLIRSKNDRKSLSSNIPSGLNKFYTKGTPLQSKNHVPLPSAKNINHQV